MVTSDDEVVVPIYVGEPMRGGLGGELLAELGGEASWGEGEGFEDCAMFGILPIVGAEVGKECCAGGGGRR